MKLSWSEGHDLLLYHFVHVLVVSFEISPGHVLLHTFPSLSSLPPLPPLPPPPTSAFLHFFGLAHATFTTAPRHLPYLFALRAAAASSRLAKSTNCQLRRPSPSRLGGGENRLLTVTLFIHKNARLISSLS